MTPTDHIILRNRFFQMMSLNCCCVLFATRIKDPKKFRITGESQQHSVFKYHFDVSGGINLYEPLFGHCVRLLIHMILFCFIKKTAQMRSKENHKRFNFSAVLDGFYSLTSSVYSILRQIGSQGFSL